jgi:hypothetical protein
VIEPKSAEPGKPQGFFNTFLFSASARPLR